MGRARPGRFLTNTDRLERVRLRQAEGLSLSWE